MKANNGSGNNETRDEWQTPKWLFEILDNEYNFIFDCCSIKENKKTDLFSSNFENIRRNEINNMCCWMNPPFSKAETMFKHFFKIVEGGVAIYRADNFETKIWQRTIFPNATWIFIPNKRIAYEGMNGNGSRFPSALIGLNVYMPTTLGGITLKPQEGT